VLQAPHAAAAERELQASAKAMGLLVAADEQPPLLLWPEHVPALRLFGEMQGQWRMGPAGPVALDRMALPDWARHGGRRGATLRWMLDVMESEALEWVAEQRPRSPGP